MQYFSFRTAAALPTGVSLPGIQQHGFGGSYSNDRRYKPPSVHLKRPIKIDPPEGNGGGHKHKTALGACPPMLLWHRAVVVRAGRTGSSGSEAEKERNSIPNTIYRSFPFPDLETYVRGLDSPQRLICCVAFLAMLAGVAWLRNVGLVGLVDDTEPIFVEAARQMIVTGDYITPQFNSVPRLDQPILICWLMALSAKLFGASVWAFRLPSCLCGVGILAGIFLTVTRFGLRLSPQMEAKVGNNHLKDHFLPAIMAAAAFTLNLQVVARGGLALPDMLLTANMGAALLGFFWAYAGRDSSPPKHQYGYSLSAVFMGLACLSKGPIGIVFPACVCTCFLLFTGELSKVMNELPKLKVILAIVLINLPWYGLMCIKHGSTFLTTFFGYHNIECFMRGMDHHGGRPWWYGLAAVLIMYFPWSLSLPSAIVKVKAWTCRDCPRSGRLPMFASTWFLSGFVLFSLSSSQLPSCYLPLAPAVALLAASHLSLPARKHDNGLASGLAPALLYQLLAGFFWLFPNLLQGSGSAKVVAIGLQVGIIHLNIIAFVVLAAAGMLATRTEEYAIAYGPKVLPSNGSLAAEYPPKTNLLPLWVLHTAVMIALISSVVTPSFQIVDKITQLPVRELAMKAAQVQQEGESLIMVGEKMPSVVFYSQLPTAFITNSAEVTEVLMEPSGSKHQSALVISNQVWEGFTEPVVLAQEEDFRLMRIQVSTNDVNNEQQS